MLTLVPCYEYVVLERKDMTVYYTGTLSKATVLARRLNEESSLIEEFEVRRLDEVEGI